MASKSFIFRFGDVEVREREFRLIKAGEVLPVEPKAFRVLLFLLRNPQKLISKEELLNAVWSDAAVSENSLTRAIALLRRLLGDDIREPRYIATVTSVGYRFVCPVEVFEDVDGTLAAPDKPAAPAAETPPTSEAQTHAGGTSEPKTSNQNGESRAKPRRLLLPATGLLALALGTAFWFLHRPLPPPRITEYTQITHDGKAKYLVGTDGNRLYLTEGPLDGAPDFIGQVAVSGGEIAKIPVALPGPIHSLQDISPDGASLLLSSSPGPKSRYPLWNVRILGGSVRRLGDAWDAAFSPDGSSVAYSTPDGEIWLARSDGTAARKLATVGGTAERFAWSPDGSTIRFSMNDHLWEMTPGGSNLHQLLPGWRGSSMQCCGRWTADGKFYVFQSQISGLFLRGAQLWALDERREFLRQPSKDPIQLTTGPIGWGSPIPGKDPRTIYSQGITFRGELSRFDPQTKQFQPLLGGISAQGVSFSRDGRYVAYVSYPDGVLWKANRDGTNPVQLTDPSMEVFLPRWSPDGTQILFNDLANMSSPGGRLECYVVPSEGGAPLKLLPEDNSKMSDPKWSPDGHRIVFTPWLGGGIRVLDVDSRKVTPLPGSTDLYSPRWSPNGRYIAAMASPAYSLSVFDFETQRWSVIPQKGRVGFPEWSSDSQWIYFVLDHGGRGIFRIRVAGGEAEQVVDLKDWHLTGWWGDWMGLDPTDAPLLLRDIGSDDIYALTLDEK